MADVASTLRQWSVTAGSNSPSGSTVIGGGLDDNLRQIQAVIRQFLAAQASNMASSGTVDLSMADGFYINVTGTTTITALGTEGAGIHYLLKFAGALTFTHNATSLILPGGANITTAAGDLAWMISEGSGNWRCISYTRASGHALVVTAADLGTQTANTVLSGPTSGAAATATFRALTGADGGSMVLIQTNTPSAAATSDFTTGVTGYDSYLLQVVNLVPATNGADLQLLMSVNAGSTWQANASSYAYQVNSQGANSSTDYSTSSTGAAFILVSGGTNTISSTSASGGVQGSIQCCGFSSATQTKALVAALTYGGTVAYGRVSAMGVGQSSTLQGSAVNGLRIQFSSGNIASGTLRLFGIRNS